MPTYNSIDDVIVEGSDFELIPDGVYNVEVKSLDLVTVPDFQTGSPVQKIKIVYRVTDGDWTDATLDELVSIPKNITDTRATLHDRWKALMGETPVAGGQYPPAKLRGRKGVAMVEGKANAKGQVWPRLKSLSAAAQPRRRVPTLAPVSDDDELSEA